MALSYAYERSMAGMDVTPTQQYQLHLADQARELLRDPQPEDLAYRKKLCRMVEDMIRAYLDEYDDLAGALCTAYREGTPEAYYDLGEVTAALIECN